MWYWRCPFCGETISESQNWFKADRKIRRHIKAAHPDVYNRSELWDVLNRAMRTCLHPDTA